LQKRRVQHKTLTVDLISISCTMGRPGTCIQPRLLRLKFVFLGKNSLKVMVLTFKTQLLRVKVIMLSISLGENYEN